MTEERISGTFNRLRPAPRTGAPSCFDRPASLARHEDKLIRKSASWSALPLALWLATIPPQLAAQPAGAPAEAVAARVIVKLKPGSALLAQKALAADVGPARAGALGKRLGLALGAGILVSERTQVVLAAGITSDELARRLAEQGDVEYAVPDRRRHRLAAPSDPLYANGAPGGGPAVGQWYLRAPTATAPAAIDAEAAWAVTTGDPTIVVAVLDTGVRFEHPDLRPVAAGGNLLPGYDMIGDSVVGNDGNGRDGDASDPGDWLTLSEVTSQNGPFHQCSDAADDSSWHGTQVAGLIAALTGNGIGMASVGRNVRVLPVRVLGKCGGYDSDIIAAMRWAAGLPVPGVPANANRAQVINLSLGGDGGCTSAYRDVVSAVNAAGTSIVASAGNATGHAVSAPASCPGVIAVGGLRHVGTKVGYSDVGPEVAISAPAGNCVNTDVSAPCLYPILTTSNAGTTTAAESIYTDSYNPSLGTSFSAPLVSGAVALMLSVQPMLTPQQVLATLQATARPFPGSADATVPVCTAPQYDAAGSPVNQLECRCTTTTCGAGMLDAGAAVAALRTTVTGTVVAAEGLWWNSPAGSEPGWGINFAQQGDVVFATWFTYDVAGKPWWLIAELRPVAGFPDVYTGPVSTVTGPPFGAPFDPAQVVETVVGTMAVSFASRTEASLSYSVNGFAQSKSITKQVFGPLPTCVWQPNANLALATNFQDLWWRAPAGTESGWGINFTQQGDIIFATWFTYDAGGKPWWLIAELHRQAAGANAFAGPVSTVTGPAFGGPFNPASVVETVVGSATVSFADGNDGVLVTTVNGLSQSRSITRQIFGPSGGTICQ